MSRKIRSVMTTLRILIITAAVLGLAACSFDASFSTPNFTTRKTNPQQ